jgi:uncharacterized protein (DUF4415 family)
VQGQNPHPFPKPERECGTEIVSPFKGAPPAQTEKFWRNAVRNPFYRPVKKQLTLRLDADVIAWLRRQGKGYQTRANALLRAAMLEDVKEKAS